ncbi:MAG: hypothetical protein ACRC1M_06905 [Methanobacteriaceae archaeon]
MDEFQEEILKLLKESNMIQKMSLDKQQEVLSKQDKVIVLQERLLELNPINSSSSSSKYNNSDALLEKILNQEKEISKLQEKKLEEISACQNKILAKLKGTLDVKPLYRD